MPEWTAPFHMPVLTDDAHAKRKAEYVAKYGYKITIPGLEDIIHVGMPEPISLAENIRWKKREYDTFTAERLEELRRMKAKKKARFDALMSSPSPPQAQNLGTIMCALDDAQDCLSTMACIGRLASAVAPRLLGKILAGPIGICMSASDVLNLINSLPRYCLTRKAGKRRLAAGQVGSMQHNKARVKLKTRLRRAMPKKADWIQAAQTTDQVFGFGISLGPIVGLAQDIYFGTLRFQEGYDVKIDLPAIDLPEWQKRGSRLLKSAGAWWSGAENLPPDDRLEMIAAQNLANQIAAPIMNAWNPLDYLPALAHTEIMAPVPTDPLTVEVIEEAGLKVRDTVGWPQTNRAWATVQECQEASMWGAVGTLKRFTRDNQHNFAGLMGGFCANMGAMFMMSAFSDDEKCEYDYTPSMKLATIFAENGLAMDPDQPRYKFRDFAGYLHMNDKSGYSPSFEEAVDYCNGPAQIKLITYGK